MFTLIKFNLILNPMHSSSKINITLTRRKTIPLRNVKTEGDFTIKYTSPIESAYVN